ncbi:hypothetical protein HZA33_00175 [Candidatus Pacearchaeota archaeon]|nr:hypothetical protein [Candidatus Pacearchaeota archaeon]
MKIFGRRKNNNTVEKTEIEKFPCKTLEEYLEKKIIVTCGENTEIKKEGYLKHVSSDFFYLGEKPDTLYTHTFIVYWKDVALIKDENQNNIYGGNIN